MFPIDFCHIPVSIIKRSAGRSAVAAAAYRSGTKLTNEWDGMTHDYTRKGGIVHAEIMLPAHAPPEFADRSILWNSVEQIEKARDSQLAREIEAALPRELSGEQQLALVRAYVKDNFVDKGMCADFAIHDKGTGNPHVHIMLTLRPLKENGQWGAKCRKAYDLDENGQRIPDGKGGWKNHREDTTDWNDKGNVEIWRAAWAAYTNRALESAGRPERIDHRSYKRQGIDKIPSVHLGPAASQMEKRGIRTDKGEVNRQIVADNKLLKEIKARITRLYRWSKAEAEKPQTQQSSLTALWEAQQQLNAPRTRTGKIRALQESAALFSFLQANGIQSMQQLHEKIADMNSCYYGAYGRQQETVGFGYGKHLIRGKKAFVPDGNFEVAASGWLEYGTALWHPKDQCPANLDHRVHCSINPVPYPGDHAAGWDLLWAECGEQKYAGSRPKEVIEWKLLSSGCQRFGKKFLGKRRDCGSCPVYGR